MVGAKGEYTSLESGISGASRTFVTRRSTSLLLLCIYL